MVTRCHPIRNDIRFLSLRIKYDPKSHRINRQHDFEISKWCCNIRTHKSFYKKNTDNSIQIENITCVVYQIPDWACKTIKSRAEYFEFQGSGEIRPQGLILPGRNTIDFIRLYWWRSLPESFISSLQDPGGNPKRHEQKLSILVDPKNFKHIIKMGQHLRERGKQHKDIRRYSARHSEQVGHFSQEQTVIIDKLYRF